MRGSEQPVLFVSVKNANHQCSPTACSIIPHDFGRQRPPVINIIKDCKFRQLVSYGVWFIFLIAAGA
ncbi:hypothetical protein JB92DRAFT_2896706 [Gautieria morchelliformis]|nr:hypothetical protein JB92DRAFT_3049777 [Gautieria morchelliformis]KAF8519957.1 hypothetical protein JB92DRAFT_2896706 [Gautieria morchelliformis]